MSTYGEMQAEIADDLARSDLTDQIKNSIKAAIRFYEGQRFAFNETTGSFNLVVGQDYYSSSDFSDIPNIFAIDSCKVTVNGSSYSLFEKSFAEIDALNSSASTTGDPTDYALYKKQIRFYPIPSDIRVISLAYAYKFAELSADADTNAWMTDGYDLIKAAAKAKIYENVLHDYDQADRMKLSAAQIKMTLVSEYEMRDTGNIKPTSF